MSGAFNHEGVDIFHACSRIGNDGSLRNHPIAVFQVAPVFINAYVHAVQVEVGQLSVGFTSQIDSAVNAEGEHVDQLGVVGMVDKIGIGVAGHDGVDNVFVERASEFTHIGRVHVAVENARDVVAAVDGDKLSAEWVAVAVFTQDLFAKVLPRCAEIHGHIFAVEGKAGECDALDDALGSHLDGGFVRNDFVGVVKRLLRVPELDAANLCGRFHGDERFQRVGDDEE